MSVFAAGAFAAICQSANAGMVSTTFDLTNSNSLSDGPIYGTVEVTYWNGSGANTNAITFKVVVDPLAYVDVNDDKPGKFGIHTFGFNYDTAAVGTLTAGQFSGLPTDWKAIIPAGNLDGFGFYLAGADKDKGLLVTTLEFSITGLGSNNTLDNFKIASSGGSGSAHYVAHIQGFDSGVADPNDPSKNISSHWVGDDDFPPFSVPEPSSIALLSIGAVSALGYRRRQKSKATA